MGLLPSYKPAVSLYCQKWRVSSRDLAGPFRARQIVCARVEIARTLWNIGYTTVRIAKLLQRDHSTVVYYLGLGKRKVMNYKGVTVMAQKRLTNAQRAKMAREDVRPERTTKSRKKREMSDAERRKWERARAMGPVNVGASR